MITPLFIYFAQYPSRQGTLALATKGTSTLPDYALLIDALNALGDDRRIAGLDHYVFAQDIDDIAQRIDRLTGSFLFVDYGDIRLTANHPRHALAQQRIAATIAQRIPDSADPLERLIHSQQALDMLRTLHAHIVNDAEDGTPPLHLSRDTILDADITPFASPELHAYGWTLLLEMKNEE